MLAACASLGLLLPAAGQQPAKTEASGADGVSATEANSAPDAGLATEAVDEVVVRGRRSLHKLELEVQAARERVYELFNAYNADDDLDIRCSSEIRTGSHFKQRVCRGNYIDRATGRAGGEVLRSIQYNCPQGLSRCPAAAAIFDNAISTFQDEYKVIPHMDLRLDETMHRLADENPELAESIEAYRAKEREYREYRDAAKETPTTRRRK